MPERTDLLRVGLAQINPTVGDIRGNARKISDYTARVALDELASQTHGIVALVGYPEKAEDVYNTAAVLADGEVLATYRKMYLPNYGVFDEQRYFQSGAEAAIFELNGIPIGISICEDIWEPGPPAMTEALGGAQVIVNLSASPYRAGYGRARERMLVQRAIDYLAAMVFVNTVGGQDELVFDGHSLAVADGAARDEPSGGGRAPSGAARGEAASGSADTVGGSVAELLDPEAELYAALCTGLRDYVEKNRFEHVVLALSGGIDSALTALIAADALGPERVTCVSLPSPYSSDATRADARAIARNLGVDFLELSIEDAMGAYDELLREPFAGREPDI